MTTDRSVSGSPPTGTGIPSDGELLSRAYRQCRAVDEATEREIDAPPYATTQQREAWADGYTKACEDVRTAMRGAVE